MNKCFNINNLTKNCTFNINFLS